MFSIKSRVCAWFFDPGWLVWLQPGHEKVNIIRSFSTPGIIGDKVESFRREGKGYVLLRTASPHTSHALQPSEAVDTISLHTAPDFDIEKGEDVPNPIENFSTIEFTFRPQTIQSAPNHFLESSILLVDIRYWSTPFLECVCAIIYAQWNINVAAFC